MRARIRPAPLMIPVVGLLLLVCSGSRSAWAQAEGGCQRPDGVEPLAAPSVTAQQVEAGSASLKEFALVARDHLLSQSEGLRQGGMTLEEVAHFGCLMRQEGGPWRSSTTYLVQLTPDGRVLIHAKEMSLSGRLLKPSIYAAILQATGIGVADLLAGPSSALAAFTAAAEGQGGPFEVPPNGAGYASVYLSANFEVPIVVLAGFDLDESHLAEESIEYGNPAVTAEQVVDRETLKAFVTGALEHFLAVYQAEGVVGLSKVRTAFRDPDGPWRHGSVYLYLIDRISNLILFHAAFPNRFELQPAVAISLDAVTGELILPQVLEAAASSPEGGFVEYYFDDPADDSDSADVPKVGYAREFTGRIERADGSSVPTHYVIGSGFYSSVPTSTRTASWGQIKDQRP